jgi:hypothetical protein
MALALSSRCVELSESTVNMCYVGGPQQQEARTPLPFHVSVGKLECTLGFLFPKASYSQGPAHAHCL